MDPQSVSLIISGVILFLIFISVLFGLKRGFRKSWHRAVWLVAISLVLVIAVPYISNWLFTFDITFAGLEYNGALVTSISDYVTQAAQNSELSELLTAKPEIINSVLTIASLFLNVILYVVLFWVLKILSWPFYAYFSRNKKEKRTKEQLERIKKFNKGKEESKVLEVEKPKKRRLLGGLVGFFVGALIVGTTLMPIVTINNIIVRANEEIRVVSPTNSEVTVGIADAYIPEEIMEYLNAYNNSFGAKFYTYSGIEAGSIQLFRQLTSANIENSRVCLYDEAINIAKIAGRVMKYTDDFDFENITSAQVSVLIDDARYIIENIFNSGFVGIAGYYLLPYYLNNLADSDLTPTDIAELDTAIQDALSELSDTTVASLKHDALLVVDIIEAFNDEDLLLPMIRGELTDVDDITASMSKEFVKEIFTMFLDFNVINTVLPNALQTGIEYMGDEFGFVTDFAGVVYNAETRGKIADIFANFYGVYLTLDIVSYTDLDGGEDVIMNAITRDTFVALGTLMDSIINFPYITDITYNNATAVLKSEIMLRLDETGMPVEIADIIEDIVDSVISLDDWSEAMGSVGDIYLEFLDMYNSIGDISLVESSDIIPYLDNIGRMVDYLDESGIVGNVDSILSQLLDYAESVAVGPLTELGFTVADVEDIFDIMATNLDNVDSWETEFTALIPLAEEIFDLMDDTSGIPIEDRLLTETKLRAIGVALDSYSEDGNLLTNTSIASIIDIAEDVINSNLPNGFQLPETAISTLSTNIADITSWETELVAIFDIYDYMSSILDSEDPLVGISATGFLSGLGAVLDNNIANGAVLINNNMIKVIFETALNFVESEMGSDLSAYAPNLITNIQNNIDSLGIVSWEDEFGAFEPILNFDFESVNFDTMEGLSGLGLVIDNLVINSSLIDNALIQNTLISVIDHYTFDMEESVIRDLFDNIMTTLISEDVTSWETEFDSIVALRNYLSSVFDSPSTAVDIIKAPNYLSGLGALIDTNIDNGSVVFGDDFIKFFLKELIDMFADEATILTTYNSTIITDLENNVDSLTNTVWQNELGALESLIAFDFGSISVDTYAGLQEMGAMFDDVIAASNIFDYDVVAGLVSGLMNHYKTTIVDDYVIELIDTILVDLNTVTFASWETEFGAVEQILAYDLATINTDTGAGLVAFGTLLDSIKTSMMFKPANINSLLQSVFSDAYDDLVIEGTTDENVLAIYTELLANISLLGDLAIINQYQIEMDYISDMIVISQGTITIDDAVTLGASFDDISNSIIIGNAGTHILAMIVDDIDLSGTLTDVSTIPTTLETNINTILSDEGYATPYTQIFTDLKAFVNFIDSNMDTGMDVATADISGIGINLDILATLPTIGQSVVDRVAVEFLTIIWTNLDTGLTDIRADIQSTITAINAGTNEDSFTTIFEDLETAIDA